MSSGQGQRAAAGQGGDRCQPFPPLFAHTHDHQLPRTHKRCGKLDGSARCEQYVAGACPTPCLATGWGGRGGGFGASPCSAPLWLHVKAN